MVHDRVMAGIAGFDGPRDTRTGSLVPILVLPEREAEAGTVAALDLGADDSLTTPFSMAELLARLRVLLRRARPGAPELLSSGLCPRIGAGTKPLRRAGGGNSFVRQSREHRERVDPPLAHISPARFIANVKGHEHDCSGNEQKQCIHDDFLGAVPSTGSVAWIIAVRASGRQDNGRMHAA
jgi:DNA-binding response OmpR family regulator